MDCVVVQERWVNVEVGVSCVSQSRMVAHIYTYIHIHTHTYTNTHIHTHTYIHTYIHTHTQPPHTQPPHTHIHALSHTLSLPWVDLYLSLCSLPPHRETANTQRDIHTQMSICTDTHHHHHLQSSSSSSSSSSSPPPSSSLAILNVPDCPPGCGKNLWCTPSAYLLFFTVFLFTFVILRNTIFNAVYIK